MRLHIQMCWRVDLYIWTVRCTICVRFWVYPFTK